MVAMRHFGFGNPDTRDKRWATPNYAPPPIETSITSQDDEQSRVSSMDLPQGSRPSWARVPDSWAGQFVAPEEEQPPETMKSVASTRAASTNAEDGLSDSDQGSLVELDAQLVEDGSIYAGQWRGEYRHGWGVLTRRDGQRYEGDFIDGCAYGHGVYTDPIGNRYDGSWVQDRMHGFGKYSQADGSSFEGVWYQDQKSGKGIEIFVDGSRYEGEFLLGSRCGYGRFTSADGKEYEGQFLSDKMDGEGKMKFKDGRTYKGQWRSGHIHGTGTTTWLNGCKYEGNYVNDLKHGAGTFTWADGRIYRGQWSRGKQHGVGTTIDEHGHNSTAEWKMGIRLRNGRPRPNELMSPRGRGTPRSMNDTPRSMPGTPMSQGPMSPRGDSFIPTRSGPRFVPESPRERTNTEGSNDSYATPKRRPISRLPTSYFGDPAPVEVFECGDVGRRVYML